MVLHDEVEGVDVALPLGDTVQVLLQHPNSRKLATADPSSYVDRGGLPGCVLRHGASPMIRGIRKRLASTSGAWDRTSSRFRQGPHDVLSEHVGQREGVRRWGYPLNIEGCDVRGVLEHGGQLGRIALQLLLGEAEAGQTSDVSDVALRDRLRPSVLGHPVIVTTHRDGGGATFRERT